MAWSDLDMEELMFWRARTEMRLESLSTVNEERPHLELRLSQINSEIAAKAQEEKKRGRRTTGC